MRMDNQTETKNSTVVETDETGVLAKSVAEKEISETATVFGQSEEELGREFKKFKALKLFAKIFCDLTAVTDDDEFEEKLGQAVEYGFGGAFVLPSDIIKTRQKVDKNNFSIFAAVCYPFGEEGSGVKKLAVKRAATQGANRILVPVGVKAVKAGNFDFIRREFKKCVKVNKIVKITALVECGSLSAEEVERAVKVLSSAGVTSFCGNSGFRARNDGGEYKLLRSNVKSGGELMAIATDSGGDVISLFHVADTVIAKNCDGVAERINKKLGI